MADKVQIQRIADGFISAPMSESAAKRVEEGYPGEYRRWPPEEDEVASDKPKRAATDKEAERWR